MRARLSALNWIGHVLVGVGLAAPCMTVTPRLGEQTGFGRWLGLVDEPRTYSILSGIGELLAGAAPVIGAVLLVFSVLFPIAKLVAVRAALGNLRRGRPARTAAVQTLGKYSMVDVVVIALIVVASKSFPGGTEVNIRWGVYPFAAAALLSVFTSHRLARAAPVAEPMS
ncbi:MAG: paraquat-inducible protein A [Planctomycetota bacterium]|nr:paraquat-inducible protein A [Planctomycetota bacterium]